MPKKRYPITKRASKTKAKQSKAQRRSVKILTQQMNANKGTVDMQTNEDVSQYWENMGNLFPTSQGDDYGSRHGSNIIGKSVSIRGLVKRADTTNRVRIVAVMFESQADNSIANVFQYGTPDINFPNQTLNSPYKINGDCKYKILADKEYVVDANHEYARVRMKFNIPSDRAVMKYTSTGLSTPSTNAITIFAVSDSTVTTHPQVVLNIRHRFLA